jgi:hypothetical protein
MELWIAKGNKKELKKKFPFLRDFAVIDIREVANLLGYESSIGLDQNATFVLSSEIKKRLISLNASRRFFRVLYLVEEYVDFLNYEIINFSVENGLKYDTVYCYNLSTCEFDLVCEASDFESNEN